MNSQNPNPQKKLLIANRGEVAARITAAARELGLFVGLISAQDDCDCLAAELADEIHIIPSGADDKLPYLNQGAILDVLKHYDFLHPGFGFLSENSVFAKSCGKKWVGPTPEAMELLGSKIAGKKLCDKLGIPTSPYLLGKDLKAEDISKKVGFPCLIKAAYGGGGKGMKIVNAANELEEQLASARREAERAFGSDELLVEKLILDGAHVEVQIFGSESEIHVFPERDCSAQRRFQKILEESPSPNCSADVQKQLLAYAKKLGESVHYRSAGTVEFLVRGTEIYFLEVNTRLQVEHGVTEELCGIDLVRAQLELALGIKPSTLDPKVRGHAIEARIYAENPLTFLPEPGEFFAINLAHGPGIRIEVGAPHKVTGRYDPMIAKMISWGTTRSHAITRLTEALKNSIILGPQTNRDFLIHILPKLLPPFSTKFLETLKNYTLPKELDLPVPRPDLSDSSTQTDTSAFRGTLGRLKEPSGRFRKLTMNHQLTGEAVNLNIKTSRGIALERGSQIFVCTPQYQGIITSAKEKSAGLSGPAVQYFDQAPFPGNIVKINVQPGQILEANELIMVMEAMKMEFQLRAPKKIRITQVLVSQGQKVAKGFQVIRHEEA